MFCHMLCENSYFISPFLKKTEHSFFPNQQIIKKIFNFYTLPLNSNLKEVTVIFKFEVRFLKKGLYSKQISKINIDYRYSSYNYLQLWFYSYVLQRTCNITNNRSFRSKGQEQSGLYSLLKKGSASNPFLVLK